MLPGSGLNQRTRSRLSGRGAFAKRTCRQTWPSASRDIVRARMSSDGCLRRPPVKTNGRCARIVPNWLPRGMLREQLTGRARSRDLGADVAAGVGDGDGLTAARRAQPARVHRRLQPPADGRRVERRRVVGHLPRAGREERRQAERGDAPGRAGPCVGPREVDRSGMTGEPARRFWRSVNVTRARRSSMSWARWVTMLAPNHWRAAGAHATRWRPSTPTSRTRAPSASGAARRPPSRRGSPRPWSSRAPRRGRRPPPTAASASPARRQAPAAWRGGRRSGSRSDARCGQDRRAGALYAAASRGRRREMTLETPSSPSRRRTGRRPPPSSGAGASRR